MTLIATAHDINGGANGRRLRAMTRVDTRQRRPRGLIDKLPSGRLRVRVYTGYDPVTKRRHYTARLCQSGGPNRRP
jgi:hypothetical protein